MKSRDATTSAGLPGVGSLPAPEDTGVSGGTNPPAGALDPSTLVAQTLEVRASVGQAFEAFSPKPRVQPVELEGIDQAKPTHTVLSLPREEASGPLVSVASLRAAFPMYRAELDHKPLLRKRPGPVAKDHLLIKESGGNLLLVEVLGPTQVRVSLGKRTDYERGSAQSREIGPADPQFLRELAGWVKRKVVDDLHGPETYGPLNALRRAADPEAEPLADRFERVEALGRAITLLSAEDQRRVISSSDTSDRSLPQHFQEFAKRALGHSDGDRSADVLGASWGGEPNVLYFGNHEYGGHSGGLSVWREDAYIQGYYHRRLQEGATADLWQGVLAEQPMLAWNQAAGSFELKRGAEVQAHLLGELTKDAGTEGVPLYRGMSNFEGSLFALSAALQKGELAPPDWRTTLSTGLRELAETLEFQESYERRAGSTTKADATAQRREKLATYTAKLTREMNEVRDPRALQDFLRAQLVQAVSSSSFGAYFLTPSPNYANRFGGGQVAEFRLPAAELKSLSDKKQAYVGLERSVEVGLLAGQGQLDPGALVDLLIHSYASSKPTQPDY